MSRTAVLVAAAALALGCVSKNNHELVVIQLDATRTALSAHQMTSREEIMALEAQIRMLEEQISARDLQLGEEVALQVHLRDELEALRAEHAAVLRAVPEPAEGEELQPVLAAAVQDVTDALAVREDAHVAESRRHEHVKAVEERFAALVEGGWAEVVEDGDVIIVRLPVAKLFNEGRIILSPRGEATMDVSATALTGLPGYEVQVVGHTDDRPFHSAEHASSWELAFARAVTVLRVLEEKGVTLPLSAASFAGRSPIASNDTPEGRRANARVELWLRAVHVEMAEPTDEVPEDTPDDPGDTPEDPEAPEDGAPDGGTEPVEELAAPQEVVPEEANPAL